MVGALDHGLTVIGGERGPQSELAHQAQPFGTGPVVAWGQASVRVCRRTRVALMSDARRRDHEPSPNGGRERERRETFVVDGAGRPEPSCRALELVGPHTLVDATR